MIAVSFPHSICPLWTQLGLSGKAWTHASCTVSSSSLSLDFKVDFFFCLHKLLLFFQKQTRKNWIPTLKTMFKREKYCIQVLTNSCSTNLWILNISVLYTPENKNHWGCPSGILIWCPSGLEISWCFVSSTCPLRSSPLFFCQSYRG